MINTATAIKTPSITADYSTEQHTVLQTLLLHLLPGAILTIAFILLGPWMKANHLPPMLAIICNRSRLQPEIGFDWFYWNDTFLRSIAPGRA